MSKVLAVNSMWKLRTEYIEFDSPTFSINRILTDEEIIVSKMELEALRDALNTIDL